MAILQDRLSTEPVPADYIDPDGRDRDFDEDWEDGPIAVTDTSQGLQYQPWKLTTDGSSFTITPEISGVPVNILTGLDVVHCSFTFDQNARPAIVWLDSSSIAHLYWYDSVQSNFVITDFGLMKSVMLSLDDKRDRQSGASDILFWYTISEDGAWSLYHRRQRDRYDDPIKMAPNAQIPLGTVFPYLYKTGMHEALRGQIILAGSEGGSIPPTVPPGPSEPQANLDFELGDVYWNKIGDFTITQADPFAGDWSSVLTAVSASNLENAVYTLITPEDNVFVSCIIKGTVATDIKLGFKFYNEVKTLVGTDVAIASITTDWTQIVHSLQSPANAVYIRIYVESNSTAGTVSLDNFNFFKVIDIGQFYEVELGITVHMTAELAELELFEVEI